MLKILVISIFLLIATTAFSQGGYLRPNNSFGDIRFRGAFEKELRAPTGGATLSAPVTTLRQAGFQYDTVNHLMFIWKPELNKWDTLATGTVSGGGSTITSKDTSVVFDGTFSSFTFSTGLSYDPSSIIIKVDKIDGEGYFKQYDPVAKTITMIYGFPPRPQAPATTITIKYTAVFTQ